MRRLLIPLAAALAAVLAGSAIAEAQRPAKPQRPAGPLAVAAQYLQLTPRALRAELHGGTSLAQVATTRGKSVEGLKQALLGALKARLDAHVAAGKLSAERAQQRLARAPAHVDRLVNRVWKPKAARPHRAAKGVVGAAAAYLGLTRQQLAAEWRAGKSLAQIAAERGKSVAGLKQALLDAIKVRLDAAVAAGRITAAHAERLLARAPARIERLVTRTRR